MHVCAVIGGLSGERAALAAYVLRTLLGTLGLPHEVATEPPGSLAGRLAVCYGPAAPATDAAACVEIACPEPPTPEEAARGFAGEPPGTAGEGTHLRIDADIVAAAGLWLTGGDEPEDARDGHGRVCGARTPRGRAGLLQRPVVTELMQVLWHAIRRVAEDAAMPLVRKAAWPNGHRFAVLADAKIQVVGDRDAVLSSADPDVLGLLSRSTDGESGGSVDDAIGSHFPEGGAGPGARTHAGVARTIE